MKWIAQLCAAALPLIAAAAAHDPAPFAPSDASLQHALDAVVAHTFQEFTARKLATNQLAVTLVDLSDASSPRLASFRGHSRIYPASVVKLFYLAAAHRWMEDGRLNDTPELRRAMRDMIVESSNDATHYVLDALTDTTSGPELPEAEMAAWGEKRNAVNRYFASLGYTDINANQKPWCEGPYGRDRIWVGKGFGNRNVLTTEATARLLTEIVLGRCVNADRCRQMMSLLERDRVAKSTDPDNQAVGFTALGLPADAKLWSKAGWTSTARHDAAYVEIPGGARFVSVIFTTGHANEREIIASITRQVSAALGANK